MLFTELIKKKGAWSDKAEAAKNEIESTLETCAEIKDRMTRISNEGNKKVECLRRDKRLQHEAKAYDYIQKEHPNFRDVVYGPIMIELEVVFKDLCEDF